MITALLFLSQTIGLPPCDYAAAERGVQQEMNLCAAHDFRMADRALNEQWRITSKAMKERDRARAEWTPTDERPSYFNTLLEAQRAWISFRDAHCRLEGYEARGGSLEPLLVSTCKTHLTKLRTEELRTLAEEH